MSVNHRDHRQKICVLRALKLGDMLCSIPALKLLRNKYPHAEISLVGLPVMERLIHRYSHLIDRFIPFPGFPGMPEQEVDGAKVLEFLQQMQRENFDLLLQMQGSGELSNPLCVLFGAKQLVGHFRPEGYRPLNGTLSEYPHHLHEIHRCLSVVQNLGMNESDVELEFPLSEDDVQRLEETLEEAGIRIFKMSYYCLHPGASVTSKRWNPQDFARVADYLIESGHEVVFTGSSSESDLVDEIKKKMHYEAINTAALDLPLGLLAALLKHSLGLICNDTGVSHLGAALKIPSIVIFSETDPLRWAPLNQDLHHWFYQPSVNEVLTEVNNFFLRRHLLKTGETLTLNNTEVM